MSPNWFRRGAATALILCFTSAAVVLLWSDRAPALFDHTVNVVTETGRFVERLYGVDIADRSDVPGTADQIGHTVLWGSGMLLIGWIFHRRVPVLFTAIFVFGISLIFEAGQPLLSSSRSLDPSDAVANSVGIVAASMVLYMMLLVLRVTHREDPLYADARAR